MYQKIIKSEIRLKLEQLQKSHPKGESFSKDRIFAIVASIIIAIMIIPIVFPHVNHPEMIYHIFVHIVSIIISTFVMVISFIAYIKSRNKKIFFMTLAFSVLVGVEYLYLLNATDNIVPLVIPKFNIEVSHIFLLIMVTFFGISIIKGQESKKL